MSWRGVYGLAWRLGQPWVRRYLRRRGRKAPAYLEHWDERFGDGFSPKAVGAIWIHAVSVGETRAAQPVVAALRARFPDAPLLVTQMTPTGRATAEALYTGAEVRYLPYDLPDAVAGFLRVYKPRFGVLMETEIWPNLLFAAKDAGVPMFLANARLSEKSLNGYRKIGALIRPAVATLSGTLAQTRDDAARLAELSADPVLVCGNSKYDIAPPADKLTLAETFRAAIGERPVLVAASTRDDEEALLLDAWAARKTRDALLVLVPRHPERFDAVADMVEQRGLALARRSAGLEALNEDTDVWLGDSMGELFAYYAAGDVAFVGGSLKPLGGQNLIEPASVGRPVLFGPSMFNFKEASALALAAGAARQCEDAAGVIAAFDELIGNGKAREDMADAARAFTALHRGASERMAAFIAERLSER
ncbi:lipid IV(A) 3-deoxy-D-manno-octulosonic acid transferase [Crenobacter cavernae]|uniref:3-deoxy-D-manno-octulosonic acid transferase n=1 Tax=Crenobacter cavernae TaxID=2290923 RepID=A0A345Y4U9_9NEIS|nr:lipid IV(A) 3-deoxy-D-manno-octulosonic acid transferase [Crenobacter cavernae]AXK38951.1 3-deoxy-D-manno-octulosonic acid transferase [Crenobacter cavernae]